MNGGRDRIVARLAHVDVIVGVDQFTRTNWLARELGAPIRDYFIRVGICASARSSLKDVQWEMFIELPFCHFFCCLHDQGGTVRIEQSEIVIGLGRAPFDQTEGANKRTRKAITANRKV